MTGLPRVFDDILLEFLWPFTMLVKLGGSLMSVAVFQQEQMTLIIIAMNETKYFDRCLPHKKTCVFYRVYISLDRHCLILVFRFFVDKLKVTI